jgi:DHA2 family multidrug resistance protein
VLFIPGSIVTIFMMPFVGRAMQSGFNPKILVFIGFVGIEVTLYMMTLLSPLSDQSQVLSTLYMRGFAMAFLFVPINSAILSQFSGSVMGQVSGLMNLARQIGGSFSIAMVGTLLTTRTAQNMQDMMSRVTLLNANVANYFRGTALGLSSKMPTEIGISKRALSPAFLAMWGKMQQQAFMMSFLQLIFIMMICVSFAFIPLAMMKFKRAVKVVDAH